MTTPLVQKINAWIGKYGDTLRNCAYREILAIQDEAAEALAGREGVDPTNAWIPERSESGRHLSVEDIYNSLGVIAKDSGDFNLRFIADNCQDAMNVIAPMLFAGDALTPSRAGGGESVWLTFRKDGKAEPQICEPNEKATNPDHWTDAIQYVPAVGVQMEEIDRLRQWFDSLQDVNSKYLEQADYELAARLYLKLGMRIPNSIGSKLDAAIDALHGAGARGGENA